MITVASGGIPELRKVLLNMKTPFYGMTNRNFPSNHPKRRKWQDPEKMLLEIGLGPDITFIDIGCDDGFFALPAARIVGLNDKAIAVDFCI